MSVIEDIYNNYVKINYNSTYLNKYVPLPMQFNNKKWRWENKDFPRIISLLEFKNYMLEYDKTFENVLSFNGTTDPEYEYINYKNCDNFNYDDDNIKYDLHNLNLNKKDYDFVMINQTIEHLYDPIRVLKNIYDHMCIGGIFYTNVPVNNIPHSTPYHFYTGVTPVGLGMMVKLAGFEILKIGQWGNKKYLNKMFESGWTDYNYNDNPGYNDINCPLITWCLCIKK